MDEEKRTDQQNRALHRYCEMVAEALNEQGLDVPTVLDNFSMDVMWTKENVKELLWRHAQKKMFGIHSTTKLERREQIDKIVDVITKFLGSMEVDYISFPSEEDLENDRK